MSTISVDDINEVHQACGNNDYWVIYRNVDNGYYFNLYAKPDSYDLTDSAVHRVAHVENGQLVGETNLSLFLRLFGNTLPDFENHGAVLNTEIWSVKEQMMIAEHLDAVLPESEKSRWICRPLHAGYPPVWNNGRVWAFFDPTKQRVERRNI